MRVLGEHGIEIYNTDSKGNNVLHLAARIEARYNILEMLVKSQYDLNVRNNSGDTAAHIASQKGNLMHLQALVEYGADINMLNNHSLSPLYLAILNEQ
jgi:ankyrin repeat protein